MVSYLSLIDIDDHKAAIAEMVRVLRPGGRLLVANLSGLATAAVGGGWTETADGRSGWLVDRYAEPRAEWAEWRAMRVRNWHRPLAAYMAAFLGHGLALRHFAEPVPDDDGTARAARYRRIPLFTVMDWEKHGEAGARSAAAVARSSPQPLHDRAATDAPTITLAPYETRHREAVLALCVAAWTPVFRTVREDVPGFAYDVFYPEGWERRQTQDVAGLLDSDPGGFLLAMAGDRLAGFVGVRLDWEDRMGEILIVAVRPGYQRQGLGRRLMQAAEACVAAAGLAMAMVETVADRGHAPARRLYEAMGYERWPVARYMKRLSE